MIDDLGELFEDIRRKLNFNGESPTGPAFFIGDWQYKFGFADNSQAFAYQSFFANGDAPAKAVDGSWNQPRNRWMFNADRSLSLWTYLEPMPEYDIEEPTYSEERYQVLQVGNAEFVLFNEDGSIVITYSRT